MPSKIKARPPKRARKRMVNLENTIGL